MPILVFIYYSCTKLDVHEQTLAIDKNVWSAEKPVKFEFASPDTLANYNFYINIRHTGNYEYSNLYLFVTTQAPNGKLHKDTLEFPLANNRGKWVGTGIGDIYSLRLAYKRNIRFAQPGIYTFTIEQAMRSPFLNGIADVGIRIEKK